MTSWDKRASRVSGLYDEVIERVIDSMKADVAEDGLDPSVLVELKRRWYEKLKSSGALAGGAAATSGIVSRVGAGQAIIAAQYAPPPVDTTAADVVFERITQDKGEPPAPPKTAADGSGLATGVPRGAHLYSLASDQQPIRRFDGRPAARMEPPKRGRPLALGVVECVRARADQPDG